MKWWEYSSKKKSVQQTGKTRAGERQRDVRSDAGEAHCQCVYCGPQKRGSYLCGVLVESTDACETKEHMQNELVFKRKKLLVLIFFF